jgi:hypothetical protein
MNESASTNALFYNPDGIADAIHLKRDSDHEVDSTPGRTWRLLLASEHKQLQALDVIPEDWALDYWCRGCGAWHAAIDVTVDHTYRTTKPLPADGIAVPPVGEANPGTPAPKEVAGTTEEVGSGLTFLQIEKTSVTEITIGRLFNLGNYEHIRYEVKVQVGAKDHAGVVLQRLQEVMAQLNPKPSVENWRLDEARKVLAKVEAELTETDRMNLPAYREWIAREDRRIQLRQDALERLGQLGGTEDRVDAKDRWGLDDDDREY